MKTNASYAQLARATEAQAAAIAWAIAELDTALQLLPFADNNATQLETAIAHVARARARLRGDLLHAQRS